VSKVANLLRTGTPSTLLSEGWHWWLEEMRGMMPAALAKVFAARSDWLVLELSGDSLIVGQLTAQAYQRLGSVDLLEAGLPARPAFISSCLKSPRISADRIAVALTPKQVLRRQLELPLTAPRHLRALVRHELDRCQPLPADQIYYDCRIVERDPRRHRMTVELAVAKKAPVDQMASILAGWGLAPRMAGLREAGIWPFNFLWQRGKAKRSRLSPTGALAVLAVVLSLLTLKAVFDRHEAYADRLTQAVAAARGTAEQVETSRRQADEIADRLAFLAEQRAQGQVGPWLEALTHALPDGTWVVDVERHGKSLRIKGYSTAAGALTELLDAVPGFANARFTAPLTPGGTPGTERFDLTLELRPKVPA